MLAKLAIQQAKTDLAKNNIENARIELQNTAVEFGE
jgi:hypothetical protein